MDLAVSQLPRVPTVSLMNDKNEDDHKWMWLCYLLHPNSGLWGSYDLEATTQECHHLLKPENIREDFVTTRSETAWTGCRV